jgi:hypothetical protein
MPTITLLHMKLIPTGGVFMNIVEQIVAIALILTVLVIRREYKRKKDCQACAKNKLSLTSNLHFGL